MLLITIMLVAVICSASSLASEKSQSRQFFVQLDSAIPCRSAQDRCFEFRSGAGQIQERFVKRHPPD
jgi:cell division protein FtsL